MPDTSDSAACDLPVIGSGTGGLSTAAYRGRKVIVAEMEPPLGGTTAWSGGRTWEPHDADRRARAFPAMTFGYSAAGGDIDLGSATVIQAIRGEPG